MKHITNMPVGAALLVQPPDGLVYGEPDASKCTSTFLELVALGLCGVYAIDDNADPIRENERLWAAIDEQERQAQVCKTTD